MRILIVRLGAMGDLLHALPAVTALRAALGSDSKNWIGWAIEPQWTSLLCACPVEDFPLRGPRMPLVDTVHRVPAKRWARHPFAPSTLREIRELRASLRAQRYDVCIDLQGAIRSAWIGRMAETPRMIGEADPRESLSRWLFRERIETTGVHVVEQALEVVQAVVKQKLSYCPPALPVDPNMERWCGNWLAERNVKQFVLMTPGAGWGAKRWPVERYAAVAAALAELGYASVVNAGPGEGKLAEAVCGKNPRAFAMCEGIDQLIACTRRASLFVGGDTGPLHLAAALEIPVVGIYGPTDPARNGPFGTRSRILRHPASLRDHSRRSEPEAGLLTITVDDAVRAASEMLEPEAGWR